MDAVEKIKAAKTVGKGEVGEVNYLYGTISSHPHKKGRLTESFLPDSGASLNIIGLTAVKENQLNAARKFIEASGNQLNIIGLTAAKENQLNITKLKTARKVIEASGNQCDIIGETEFYTRLDVFKGKPKRIVALVLRGNSIDREVLISNGVLKQWRLYT